jgi:hypothetical protein
LTHDHPWTHRERHEHDGLITAVAFGGFLIIVGLVFALTPSLWQNIVDFFSDLTVTRVPYGGSTSNVVLPAPANPAAHQTLYAALLQFDIAFGVLQLLILALRLGAHSSVPRIAETLGNAVFWLGATFLVNALLLAGTLSGWFTYWAALIVVVGVSMIARALVYFVKR